MTDAPGPHPSADDAVIELLRAARQILRRLSIEAHGGLTWSQITALAQLEENGPLTTADLARAEAVKPQSMSTTLASLEQDGLVRRQPHPTDGRQVLFALTEEGLSTRHRNRLLKREWFAAVVTRLGPADVEALAAATDALKRLDDV